MIVMVLWVVIELWIGLPVAAYLKGCAFACLPPALSQPEANAA
jgi:hypothetical protein